MRKLNVKIPLVEAKDIAYVSRTFANYNRKAFSYSLEGISNKLLKLANFVKVKEEKDKKRNSNIQV